MTGSDRRLAARAMGACAGTALRGLALATVLALPLAAQEATVSFADLERQYPRMSSVHITKCDRDQDGVFTRAEQLCVSSIYQVMYRDD